MVTVKILCSGHGNKYYEDVQLTREDLERIAIEKLREEDASPCMNVTDVSFCINL